MPRLIGIDTETALIRRGLTAPPMTCLSYCDLEKKQVGVVDRHKGHDMLKDWLRDDDVMLGGHNIAYDSVVSAAEHDDLLPLWFDKYAKGLVRCSMIDEQLIDISKGSFRFEVDPLTDKVRSKRYDLGGLVGGLSGKDDIRFGYGPLRDVPVEHWNDAQRKYAIEDAVAFCWLNREQERRFGGPVVDGPQQARNHFALQLSSVWGMRTDPMMVAWYKELLERSVDQISKELMQVGLIRPNGSRDMEAIRQTLMASGVQLGYTATGAISTAAEYVKVGAEDNPALALLLKYSEHLKLLTTYVPTLEEGARVPINPRINPVLETGRCSYSKPNLQNLPRGSGKPDDLAHFVRECFIPRDGNVFSSVDYEGLELRTFAQVLLDTVGGTVLRDLFQKDPEVDLHMRLAAHTLGITYEEAMQRKDMKDATVTTRRQHAKPIVFGAMGGMGAKSLVSYAWKAYGVRVTLAEAQSYLNSYKGLLSPDIYRYFDSISAGTDGRTATVRQLRSGRVRGGLRFTDCANGFFQGLAADGAKMALFEVSRRCYTDRSSPLFGCRPVCFIHDEILMEIPREQQHEAAMEQARLMCEVMERWTPDIPIRAAPALMERWYKKADAVYDENKRLIPWKPKKVEGPQFAPVPKMLQGVAA